MKKQTLLLTALCVAIGATACTTINPYSGEAQTSSAVKGGALGAATGALVGVLSSSKHDRGKGALIGAAAGAAVGGGVGYYMDVQEAKLRQKMKGTGVSVTRQGDNIILNMPNSVTFDTNSSQVKAAGANSLSGVSMVLKEYDKTHINIIGHTDSSGGRELNMRLSQQRADSVGSNLITQGVDANRISMSGAGPDQPVASNSTAEGKAQNRRVTLTLSPTQS
jgi:outer membrane protein OmpA-like peptidoglycan-associated protein